MVQINWTNRAKSDLKNIFDFIGDDSIFYAKKVLFEIEERTNIIKDNIFIGKVVPEFSDKDLREIIKYNYRIVYLIVNDFQIDIIAIVHSSRDFRNLNIEF